MANKLEIVINTSANVEGIKKASSTLNDLEHSAVGVSKTTDQVSSSVYSLKNTINSLVAGYSIKTLFDETISSGIKLSGQFETMQIGIASLISVNSKNVTSMGKHVDASQKFAMAQKDSAAAIQLLRKANLETPATLAELTRGFQSALGPAMALGFSIKDTVKYSTLMTQAAAAMGVPMDQLSQEMASILNGNIDMNSVVAKNIGLTNEQVKAHIKQGDIYNFLIGKLSDFGAAGKEMANSWDGVTSNMEDSWATFKTDLVNNSGIFNSAKDGVKEITKVLQNQNGEIDTMTRYMKDATLAGSMLYGTVLAVDTISAIRKAMGELTLAQYAFNIAAKANPYIIAGTIVAGGLTYLYDQIQKGHDEASLAGKKAGKGYADAFVSSLQDASPDQISHDIIKKSHELMDEELSIIARLKESKGFMKQSSSNDELVLTLEKRRSAIRAQQAQLVEYNKAVQTALGQSDSLVAKPHVKSDAEKKAEDEAAKKAHTAAENLKQAYLSINKDIAVYTGTEHDKAIANINNQAEKYRKSKVNEVKIGELTSAAMTALYQKENEERNKMLIDHYSTVGDDDAAYYIGLAQQIDDMVKKGTVLYAEINTFREDSDRKYLEKKAKTEFDAQVKYIENQRSALLDYYTALGNSSDAFYITESDKIQKLAETGILSNEQLVAVWDKDFAHMRDSSIKLNTVFEDAFKSMEDSMVHMFMTGKFSAEDFFNTVIEGIIRMQIRNSITSPLTEAIGGVNFGSIFSGMFGGTSAQVDASSIGSSMDWSSLGKQAWEGGLIPYYSGGAVNNFTYGGYTGDGGKYEPKGVVHGGEYVIPKWQTQRIPAVIMQLESMRKRGYADGGLVGSDLSGTNAPSMPITINVENKSGTPISAENVGMNFDIRGMTVNIVVDAINRNVSGLRDSIRSVR